MAGFRMPPVPTISEILKIYQLSAKKQLSQNFLLDMNLNRKIVRTAGKITDGYVCEVGPGPGGITRAILEKDIKELVVIEKDRRFLPSLLYLSKATGEKMKIYHGDVLHCEMDDLFPREAAMDWNDVPPNIHILGNLPFNVATPLIIRWLRQISEQRGLWSYGRTKLTLTFQKEIAERMVAPMSPNDRCRLSIMCQYLCEVEKKFVIPGASFVPAPKVDVGVVQFVPLIKPEIDLPFKLVEKVVRHIFQFRRKKIKRGISTLFPVDAQDELSKVMFTLSGVNQDMCSFMLSVQEIGRLCHVYKEICDKYPQIYDFDFLSPKGLELNRALMRERKLQKKESNLEKGVDCTT